jgi:signal peptidase I
VKADKKPANQKKSRPESKSDSKHEEEKLTVEQKIRREVFAWFWVGLIFLLINGAVGQARVIPSGSMENTLLVGDHLIMSRLGYDAGIPFTNIHTTLWRDPKRGQIVIFRPVIPGETSDVIKRVIGLPGETVDVHDGSVWINGKKLEENYTVGTTEPGAPELFVQEAIGKSALLPYTIPKGCYFLMGDNRQNSRDSRFTGCIPRDHIIGTPVMIYMSLSGPSDAWESGDVAARASAYFGALIHPSEIRWRRLFHIF